MKLRNKKTGEIVDVESLGHAESLKEKYGYQVTLSWKTEYENLSQCKDYESLAELNADWEDYKPAEPLIKDEKVRKAVRAWAEVNNIKEVHYDSGCNELNDIARNTISFNARIVEQKFIEDKDYTIAELCGEEE